MALQLDSWAVEGAQSSARIARLQLTSASRSGNGIVESADLAVRELAVPGTSVRIDPGAAIILGQEAAFQGSYYAHNIGEATLPISPTDSTGGRSDLIVLRVEDPGIDGTPWTWDPATDPVYYFRVIEGVSATETQAPAGSTAIPLARIDIPVSTATITQAMITDVRQSANPRTERIMRIQRGVEPIDYAGNIVEPDWENWPDPGWTVDVPSWATTAQIVATWGNVDHVSGAETLGWHRVRLLSGGTEAVTYKARWNFNWTGSVARHTMINADEIFIPEAMRGTTASLYMQAQGDDGITPANHLEADGATQCVVDITWLDKPVSSTIP